MPRSSEAIRRRGPPGQAIREEALRRIGETGLRSLLASALADGTLSERGMEDLVDWILRVLISYAAVPGDGGRRPTEIRRQLPTWFLPAFEAAGRLSRGLTAEAPVRRYTARQSHGRIVSRTHRAADREPPGTGEVRT